MASPDRHVVHLPIPEIPGVKQTLFDNLPSHLSKTKDNIYTVTSNMITQMLERDRNYTGRPDGKFFAVNPLLDEVTEDELTTTQMNLLLTNREGWSQSRVAGPTMQIDSHPDPNQRGYFYRLDMYGNGSHGSRFEHRIFGFIRALRLHDNGQIVVHGEDNRWREIATSQAHVVSSILGELHESLITQIAREHDYYQNL